MAIMATEEPQNIIERKVAQPEPEDDKKTTDETAEPTVNGYVVLLLNVLVWVANTLSMQPCDIR